MCGQMNSAVLLGTNFPANQYIFMGGLLIKQKDFTGYFF